MSKRISGSVFALLKSSFGSGIEYLEIEVVIDFDSSHEFRSCDELWSRMEWSVGGYYTHDEAIAILVEQSCVLPAYVQVALAEAIQRDRMGDSVAFESEPEVEETVDANANEKA